MRSCSTPRPTDLVDVVDCLTLLQIDPTAAIAPSADLVLWSRLGSTYHPADLTRAIERDRALVETVAYIRSWATRTSAAAATHASSTALVRATSTAPRVPSGVVHVEAVHARPGAVVMLSNYNPEDATHHSSGPSFLRS